MKLYNTLTKHVEEFIPNDNDVVTNVDRIDTIKHIIIFVTNTLSYFFSNLLYKSKYIISSNSNTIGYNTNIL